MTTEARDQSVRNLLQKGVSQREISRRLGIDRGTVSRIKLKLESLSHIGATDEFAAPAPIGMQYSRLSRMLRDDEGNIQWLIATQQDADKLEAMRAIAEGIVDGRKIESPPAPVTSESDWCNVITLTDLHIGMQAYEENGTVWDIERCLERVTAAVDSLLANMKPAQECWLVNPGDFLHANDSSLSTPKSKHALDHDGPYQRAVKAGGLLITQLIQKTLTKHQKVRVVNVPGNHDPDAPAWLDMLIDMVFDDRVSTVKKQHKTAHLRFGDNFLAVNHGDKMKPRALADRMTNHEYWRDTKNRYGIMGHRHKYEVEPLGNHVTIYTMSPPIPQDEYAGDGGWPVSQQIHHWALHKSEGIRHTQLLNVGLY